MKKYILFLISLIAFSSLTFSQEEEVIFEVEEDEGEYSNEVTKTIGFAPGLRLSVLGLEPTFNVFINNLELEATFAFSSGVSGEEYGIAPSFSIAYNTNPFESGASAVFGCEYMYLTSMYTNALTSIVELDEKLNADIHSFSLFYKGCVNFNSFFGLSWRFRLPLMIAGSSNDEYFNLNVTNLAGFGSCSLIGLTTISVGVKFLF